MLLYTKKQRPFCNIFLKMLPKIEKCCMFDNFFRELKNLMPIVTLLSNVTVVCNIFVNWNQIISRASSFFRWRVTKLLPLKTNHQKQNLPKQTSHFQKTNISSPLTLLSLLSLFSPLLSRAAHHQNQLGKNLYLCPNLCLNISIRALCSYIVLFRT